MTADCGSGIFLPSPVCDKIKWCFCHQLCYSRTSWLTATPPQRPFSSSPKVAVVEKFICNLQRTASIERLTLSGHLPVPRGWPFNRGWTHCLKFTGVIRACPKLYYKESSHDIKKKASYTAYLRSFFWNRIYRKNFCQTLPLNFFRHQIEYDYNYGE